MTRRTRKQECDAATRSKEPSTEEKFDVPPETASEVDEGSDEPNADRILGESSWLRSSG